MIGIPWKLLVSFLSITRMNILAIGAHPDDIEIGCGGMLIKAVKNGHSVYLYNITQGEKAGDPRQREQS